MPGPPECFEEFFRREIRSLVVFVRKLGYDIEDAKDAASHAMAEAFEHWGQLVSPVAWVRVNAQRTALRQAERRRAGVARAVQVWNEASADVSDTADLIGGKQRVLMLLDCLPTQQREVMVWYLDGFETHEIARHLGISEATVRSTKRHARTLLQKKLEDSTRQPGEGDVSDGSQ